MFSSRSALRFLPLTLLAATVAVESLPGCSNPEHDKPGVTTAAELNARGIAAKEPKQAKEFFQRAIAADAYYGPAYNNLGITFLNEENYFEAAKCFDQAIHLMPGSAGPRIDLGLVYEHAGELQNALEQYSEALSLHPESMDALQATVRVEVKLERSNEATITHLRTVARGGSTPAWQAWATRVLIRYGEPVATDTTMPATSQ